MLFCKYAFMRTTLDLPDELFRQVKAKAALDGRSLKELMTEFIASGLHGTATVAARKRSRLPVIKQSGRHKVPNLTPELQAKFDEEEDLARHRRPIGR